MRITTLVSATAISLAALIGSASATDQFATLDGLKVVPMSASELDAVKGLHVHFQVITQNGLVNPDGNGDPVAGPFFRVGDPAMCSPPGCADAPGIVGLKKAQCTGGGAIVVFDGPAPHVC